MEFFPSSGHMIGSKRSRPASASSSSSFSRKGSSGMVSGGQRPRSGRWKKRSPVGADDGDGVRRGVVSELDIFYFRKMAVSLQDKKLEQQIDHEIRMRDGTAKLLAASKNPSQLLEAAKNLHTSNARMLAYMSELQRRKTNEVLQREDPSDGNQVPCRAKVSLSDLRIPLLWKEADHFKNKDHRRYAVFCLVKIGTDIFDTALLKSIDRTCTDLTFDDVITFDDVRPDFECQLEVYCHRCQDDLSVASTPKRIKKKIEDFGNSVGRSVGKRLSGMKYDTDSTTIIGPKFDCIASATLKLADVDNYVGIFNLTLESDNSVPDLPLFGNFCCRLAAQPHCLIDDTISGPMYFQDPASLDWELYSCRLCNLAISCWKDGSDSGSPDITIPVTKTTQVSEVPASLCKREHCIQIVSDGLRYNLAAPDAETKKKWWDAIYQHLLDQVMWLQACECVMEIKTATPRRHSTYGKTMFSSLYDSVDDPASPMTRVLNRLNIPECDEEEEKTQSEMSNKTTASVCGEGEVSELDAGASSTSTNVPSTDGNDAKQTPLATDAVPVAVGDGAGERSTNATLKVGSDVLSEMCSRALADVAVCAQSDESDELSVESGRLVASTVETETSTGGQEEDNHQETSVADTATGNRDLGDKQSGDGRQDDSEPQEAQTGSSEPSGQLDEYSKENVAENSWFRMMRRNEEEEGEEVEDAVSLVDEEDDARRGAEEEGQGHEEEYKTAKTASEDAVMEGMADDDLDAERGSTSSLESAQSDVTGEGHQSDRTAEPGNEGADKCYDEEHEANSINGNRSDDSEVTGQSEGIEEAELSAKLSVDGDSNSSAGNSDQQHLTIQPEENANSERDELAAEAELAAVSGAEEFSQSERSSGSEHEEAEGHRDQSTGDANNEHDREVFSQVDDATKVDVEHEDDEGKGKPLQTEAEDGEAANEEAASTKMTVISKSTEDKTAVRESDDGHENCNSPGNVTGDTSQSESEADSEEEGSTVCVEKAEDIGQSAFSAECASQSEIVEQCVGQSEKGFKSDVNPGDEGHSDEMVAHGSEDLEQREADQLELKLVESINESGVAKVGEKQDAGKEVLIPSESGNKGSDYLETDAKGVPEKCAEAGTSSGGDQKTSKPTEEQESVESVTCDKDADNELSLDNTSKCTLSRSLSKETSV